MEKNKENTEVNIDEAAKTSNKIIYSPEVFTDGNYPKISAFILDDEKLKEKVYAFILKYDIDKIPQEVILGKLKLTDDATFKVKKIKDFISDQLVENSEEGTEFRNFINLKSFVSNLSIPFELTPEGTDILTYNKKEKTYINRTYYEKTNDSSTSSIDCFYTPEELKSILRSRNTKREQFLSTLQYQSKWKSRRNLILKTLSEEDRQLFLEGEKITDTYKEYDKSKILPEKKDLIADYLTEKYMYSYDKKDTEIYEDYIHMKEVGLASDINDVLDNFKNAVSNLPEDSKANTNMKNNLLSSLENNQRFFELIVSNRELNARILSLKLNRTNFDYVKKILTKYSDDPELVDYIDLKEKEMESVQVSPDINIDNYSSQEDVKNLYDFLSHSSVRKLTKEEDEAILLRNF